MGWTYKSVERVISKKDLFKDKRVLTLGTLFPFFSKKEIEKLKKIGLNLDINKKDFSKELFCNFLDSKSCDYLDVNKYQESDVICNLNLPIPENLKNQYDVIIDAGTLEHISNMSQGIINYFDMLDLNGIVYFGLPSNNWLDHGFYQFSPTFIKDLCIDNFDIELIELYLTDSDNNYYYDIKEKDISGYFMKIIFSSKEKFNIAGVIKKTGEKINLDLIQTKYRKLYEINDTSSSERIETTNFNLMPELKSFFINIFWWIVSIPILPIKYKYFFISFLHAFKEQIFSKK